MRGWGDSNVNVRLGATSGRIPIHRLWFSFGIRDRITAEAGNASRQTLWRLTRTGLTPPDTIASKACLAMDHWLTTLKADVSSSTLETQGAQRLPSQYR